jgi:hypothetical protein
LFLLLLFVVIVVLQNLFTCFSFRGDFKVQGGKIAFLPNVDKDALSISQQTMKALKEIENGAVPTIVRVDLVWYEERYVVSEAECIDPELFVCKCPFPQKVVGQLAIAIVHKINVAAKE